MRLIIVGATSDIAREVARHYADKGAQFVLLARNGEDLRRCAADLVVRGAADVTAIEADFANLDGLPALIDQAWSKYDGADIALIAYGSLPDQNQARTNASQLRNALAINFVSPCLVLSLLASKYEQQGSGTLAAITSVAGDRGRGSNFIYGAAKGGLQRLLEGLRHRLFASGVAVIDIRPGFVASKMTRHLNSNGILWAKPERIAEDISRAISRRKAVVYTPWFWSPIMMVVTALPRAIFHRTSL
jgi:decaprenylphospho-beta-D-erythro-pentofuranosid-2-ulose 2-reductase